jgi:hypothetical protein
MRIRTLLTALDSCHRSFYADPLTLQVYRYGQWERYALDAARAALALVAFAAGALLTAPANVCLFPGTAPGSTAVPATAYNVATSVILLLVVIVQAELRGMNPLFIPHLVYIPGPAGAPTAGATGGDGAGPAAAAHENGGVQVPAGDVENGHDVKSPLLRKGNANADGAAASSSGAS